tara:strand:+ start:16294 stop:16536 length:243 start_codon:yes stop_codon:yes gene_type:complete
MSKRKILAALKKKNIPVERVQYMRREPTPSGYANGWDIEITEDTENRLFDAGFSNCEQLNEIDTTDEVIDWISPMPTLAI